MTNLLICISHCRLVGFKGKMSKWKIFDNSKLCFILPSLSFSDHVIRTLAPFIQYSFGPEQELFYVVLYLALELSADVQKGMIFTWCTSLQSKRERKVQSVQQWVLIHTAFTWAKTCLHISESGIPFLVRSISGLVPSKKLGTKRL